MRWFVLFESWTSFLFKKSWITVIITKEKASWVVNSVNLHFNKTCYAYSGYSYVCICTGKPVSKLLIQWMRVLQVPKPEMSCSFDDFPGHKARDLHQAILSIVKYWNKHMLYLCQLKIQELFCGLLPVMWCYSSISSHSVSYSPHVWEVNKHSTC